MAAYRTATHELETGDSSGAMLTISALTMLKAPADQVVIAKLRRSSSRPSKQRKTRSKGRGGAARQTAAMNGFRRPGEQALIAHNYTEAEHLLCQAPRWHRRSETNTRERD